MRAKMLGFFSGFPARRFPLDVAQRLKQELTTRDSLVFVSAWPEDAARNDDDAAGMHAMFVEYGMSFRAYCVIDDRTDAAEARRLIRQADCIFLMGGYPAQQMRLIRDKGIAEEIRRSEAVVLGVSAGAYNMAVRSLDIREAHVPYAGLGLADVTVKAHVPQDDPALLQTLMQISVREQLPICAMTDNSAIFIKVDDVTHLGLIRWVNGDKVLPFSPALLNAP